MAGWRILGSLAVMFAAAGPGWAQTYSLVEAPVANKYFRIQVHMTLAGEIRVAHGGKKVTLKQAAKADHDFLQRVLTVGPTGLAQKCAHLYKTAKALITVDEQPSERTLRPERNLMVAQRYKDEALTYCPAGPLTREELDLTEHFDTLCLPGLLPGKTVPLGEKWSLTNSVVQALCNFEGLTTQDLQCKLEAVKNNVALVSVQGKATGIEMGALVKVAVSGTYRFDLDSHRLTALEWKQQDERDQGPASPASSAEVSTTVARTAIDPSADLSDVALVGVPDGYAPPLPMTQVYYADKKKQFDFVHGREWQTVGLTESHLVMRLMDKGDFVAQVTITPWTRDQPGKHLTPEAFQEAMGETPGWEQDQVLQAGEVPSDGERWVYRISAQGKLDNMKVVQNFFLVASPKGEQVVFAFTMTQSQAQKIGTRDLTLVGNLNFPGPAKD